MTAETMTVGLIREEIPYACFRVYGEVVKLSRTQFEQALRDSRLCNCGECLCCRARQYWSER